MRRITLSTDSSRYFRRFFGPWSPNPWINSTVAGPQKHRGVDGGPLGAECQKAALSAWEDDGGSTGAPD
jgi:hypothetical protein